MLRPFQDTPKLLNVKYHLYITLAKLMENVAIISILKKGKIFNLYFIFFETLTFSY